jgi:hypothetical protein
MAEIGRQVKAEKIQNASLPIDSLGSFLARNLAK